MVDKVLYGLREGMGKRELKSMHTWDPIHINIQAIEFGSQLNYR